jgi:hypothetical protein
MAVLFTFSADRIELYWRLWQEGRMELRPPTASFTIAIHFAFWITSASPAVAQNEVRIAASPGQVSRPP